MNDMKKQKNVLRKDKSENMRPNVLKGNKSISNRETWIDVYKGIAIMLVIIGHLKISTDLYRFIYAFHMYAFFFVSGMTYRKKEQNYLQCVLTSVKRLYIPYLFFAFMWDFTNLLWVYGKDFYQHISIKNVLGVAINYDIVDTVSVGPAWFLCSMLVVKCIYDFWQRVLKRRIIITVVCVCSFVLGCYINSDVKLPFSIIPSLTAIFFLHVGYLCKDITKIIVKCKRVTLICGSLVLLILTYILSMFHDRHLILASNELPDEFVLMLITALLGCVGLIFLAGLLDRMFFVKEIFQYCGFNSLIIMGTHSEIRIFCYFVLEHTGFVLTISNAWIVLLGTMIISIPTILILEKCPVLIGRT